MVPEPHAAGMPRNGSSRRTPSAATSGTRCTSPPRPPCSAPSWRTTSPGERSRSSAEQLLAGLVDPADPAQDRGHRRVDRHHLHALDLVDDRAAGPRRGRSTAGPSGRRRRGRRRSAARRCARGWRPCARCSSCTRSNSSRMARHGISSPSRNSWANSCRLLGRPCSRASSISGYSSVDPARLGGRAGLQGRAPIDSAPLVAELAGQLGRLARSARSARPAEAGLQTPSGTASSARSSSPVVPEPPGHRDRLLAQRLALAARRTCSRSRWPGSIIARQRAVAVPRRQPVAGSERRLATTSSSTSP